MARAQLSTVHRRIQDFRWEGALGQLCGPLGCGGALFGPRGAPFGPRKPVTKWLHQEDSKSYRGVSSCGKGPRRLRGCCGAVWVDRENTCLLLGSPGSIYATAILCGGGYIDTAIKTERLERKKLFGSDHNPCSYSEAVARASVVTID